MADDPVVGKFSGLPMEELIGAPLSAACDAQIKLARSQLDFINQVAYNTAEDGTKTTRLLEFDLERPTETPGGYEKIQTHVQAPFLGLVPIPSLLVEDVSIEFQMEVSATEENKSKSGSDISTTANIKSGFLFAKASMQIQGKVTSSRENTRSTNQTAKYQVRVNARQQTPTEGLSRLMDIMAQCTAPLPAVSIE